MQSYDRLILERVRKLYGDKLDQLDPRAVRRGFVAAADDQGRVGFVPWQQAARPKDQWNEFEVELNVLKDDPNIQVLPDGSLRQIKPDPVRKRDPLERVASLTRRLVDEHAKNPRLVEVILRNIQSEYWKAGMPVTGEELRRVASELLRRAERKKR